MSITCFEPDLQVSDAAALLSTIESKVLAFGPNVEKFEQCYSKFSKKEHNIGFNSASSAAYLLYQYLYEKYGSCDVYTPSIGFVSPVYAAIKNGHNVIFTDVNKDILMNPEGLSQKISNSKNKSIVMPVLYGGVSKIPKLTKTLKGLDYILVLDSAHCISPTMKHDYAFYSFHPVKPICMSNGGLLSTEDATSAEYMKSGRNFGREITGDTYDLAQAGFNFYMNNLNAALGLSQIHRCMDNVDKRKQNHKMLEEFIPKELGYLTKHDKGSSYYLSTLILNEGQSSAILREHLRQRGINSSFHYPFLHKTKYYKQEVELPYTDSIEDRLINLPIHQNLSKHQMEVIIDECIRYSRSGG